MSQDLSELEELAAALLAQLGPAEQRRKAREIGQALRRSQRQRIAAQRNPDGTPFAKRKPRNLRGKTGRIKRTMFAKLRTAKYLKTRVDGQGVEVGFYGRVARIARVHQEGARDQVERGGPEVAYAQRRLLGIARSDDRHIRDQLLVPLPKL